MALRMLLLLATLCPLVVGQVTTEEPLLWNILAGLADQVKELSKCFTVQFYPGLGAQRDLHRAAS